MNLIDLLKDIPLARCEGPTEREITAVEFDSRRVGEGTLFVALKGAESDGHDYIASAVEKGAVAILCEAWPETTLSGVTYLQTGDTHQGLGRIASAFYGHPSNKLHVVGVAGTNGKTSTATLLYDLFRKLGYEAGLLSTVENRVGERVVPATHTTPDPLKLNRLMAQMVAAGCQYCFMEVSSHSLVQKRTAGIRFEGGIFTNITHDHLDYHGTFAEYIRAKKMFFDALPKGAFALINEDDKNGPVMVQNSPARVRTYSLRRFSDYRARIVETLFDGMLLRVDGEEVWVKFIGTFNAYNLLAVYATALELGAGRGEVLRIVSELTPVSGRFETIRSRDGVTAVVDYAHTPDALQNVIETIDEIRRGESKLYTVVGCGGNRDRAKRPKMARIAADKSDMAILTSDNPRFEKPEDILQEMKAGLDGSARYLVIADRREAIRTAVALARPGDMILVAGKGHETYQSIQGVDHHFDDREEVARAFGLTTG